MFHTRRGERHAAFYRRFPDLDNAGLETGAAMIGFGFFLLDQTQIKIGIVHLVRIGFYKKTAEMRMLKLAVAAGALEENQ